MYFRITAELIASGRVGSSISCPLAAAILQYLRTDLHLVVTVKRLLIKSNLADGTLNIEYECELPNEAQVFISRFDNRLSIEPTSIYIPIPAEYLR